MSVAKNLILLPPSEGKAAGGQSHLLWTPESGTFGNELADKRLAIIKKLTTLRGGDEKLLGVKGTHLAIAKTKNQNILQSPGMPAWMRYTGVVWDHLALASLPTATRNRALPNILVPSGLLGLVSAHDMIPDYKLKIGARIKPFGTLNAWWRESITECLAEQSQKKLVIDLLPQEHQAAIDWTQISSVVHVQLISKTGGVVGGHNAKAAKGLLARHIIDSEKSNISDAIQSFQHQLYTAVIAQ